MCILKWAGCLIWKTSIDKGLDVQNLPEKCVIFGPSVSRLPKISKMLVEGQYTPIPLPKFWISASTKDIHKVNEIPLSLLRKLNVYLIILLDHSLITEASKKEIIFLFHLIYLNFV